MDTSPHLSWQPDEKVLEELVALLDVTMAGHQASGQEYAKRITQNQAKLNEYSEDVMFV